MEKAFLIILDGYGIAENPSVSAVDRAEKPFLDALFDRWPHASLTAGGESVGLPEGQFGNSEVGHLNIGAGRIVWQELSRINKDIREGAFKRNPVLLRAMDEAKKKGTLHVMGLLSDGGVHSHIDHLAALLELAAEQEVPDVRLHAFTDGRDTSPTGGADYLRRIERVMERVGVGEVSTVVGRYYAMDRDTRWERTELAWKALTKGIGTPFTSAADAVEAQYAQGVTDEFMPALIRSGDGKDVGSGRIGPDDVVVFFNIRGDRTRQIIRALFDYSEVPFETDPLNLDFTSFTAYDEAFSGQLRVAFPPADLRNTLGDVVSAAGLRQVRIAETEKYPHVTYFLNGGREEPLPGEERILIPSPKVATYDLQPEMSAPQVGDALMPVLRAGEHDLVVLNFANADMVGHTGVMEAAVKAVEAVDHELSRLVPMALSSGYRILVIADHGNSDCMVQPDGSPHTAHTLAPVPVLLAGLDTLDELRTGILADVAPTVLKLMGLPQPDEMTGKPLY